MLIKIIDWIKATPPDVYEAFSITMCFALLGYIYLGYHYIKRYLQKYKKEKKEKNKWRL